MSKNNHYDTARQAARAAHEFDLETEGLRGLMGRAAGVEYFEIRSGEKALAMQVEGYWFINRSPVGRVAKRHMAELRGADGFLDGAASFEGSAMSLLDPHGLVWAALIERTSRSELASLAKRVKHAQGCLHEMGACLISQMLGQIVVNIDLRLQNSPSPMRPHARLAGKDRCVKAKRKTRARRPTH
jgi:hypothetical protein